MIKRVRILRRIPQERRNGEYSERNWKDDEDKRRQWRDSRQVIYIEKVRYSCVEAVYTVSKMFFPFLLWMCCRRYYNITVFFALDLIHCQFLNTLKILEPSNPLRFDGWSFLCLYVKRGMRILLHHAWFLKFLKTLKVTIFERIDLPSSSLY